MYVSAYVRFFLSNYLHISKKSSTFAADFLKKRLSAVFWHIESGKFILTPKHSDKMSYLGVYVAV